MDSPIVDARRKKLLKAAWLPAYAPPLLLTFVSTSRILLLVVEVGALAWIRRSDFPRSHRGSLLDLTASVCLGLVFFLRLGLLLSSRQRQSNAASGLMNVVMMRCGSRPALFFSSQKISWLDAHVHQGASLDRCDRRFAREHPARLEFGADGSASRPSWSSGCHVLCNGAKLFRWR